MSRPLTGSITPNKSRGTFTASLPSGISGKRRTATFDTHRDAEVWIAEGIRLLKCGEVVPPYRRSNRTRTAPRAAESTPFIAVARGHISERYAEDGHGDIDREEQVTGYATAIDDYMKHLGLSLETITRRDVRTMWQHMLKNGELPARAVLVNGIDPKELVTKKAALELLAAHGSPVSESTFKRALVVGKLTAADTSGQAHLFRVGDVFADVAGLAMRRDSASPPHRGRFAHSTLVDVRRTFRAVIEHAEADGIPVQSGVRGAKIPRDKTPKARARALTRQEAARLAIHLHAVHQLVLWLLVLLGLRVSEAYGILVDDIIDNGLGHHGIVTIQSQGGRKFRRRNADGTITISTHLDQTKGRRSNRVLVVPASLMDLIREVIAIFHADEHGDPRPGARLVPGLRHRDEGGQSAFTNALTRAGAAEAIDITFDAKSRGTGSSSRVTPTPQKLRQSYATSHRADLIPIEDIRATLGQELGDSVLHANYLIDDLGLKGSRRIPDQTQKQLDAELNGRLRIPTAVRCTTARQPALADRAHEIDAKLLDAGWLTMGAPEGDWVTVADAAAYRGVTEHRVRDDIRAGKLAAIARSRPDQAGYRYLISADAMAGYEDLSGPSDLAALADELGVAYDVIRHFVSRHPEIELERVLGRRDGVLSDEAADHVREYFREQEALGERAVRLSDVARDLGLSVAAVDTLVRRGQLTEDIRFHGGYRSLTNASVEELKRARGRKRRRA